MATNYNTNITHIIPNEPGLPNATDIDTFYALPARAIIQPDANDPLQRRVPFNIFRYHLQQHFLNNPMAINIITDSDETETDDDVSK